MKFALVNNIKTKATKGVRGICQFCGSVLTAKCGPVRINHWAHKKDSKCDPWWENETEWHRYWKNNYPDVWQEILLTDEQTGEKHMADVCTTDNLVIEFQHSHIDPAARKSREKFYQNMVWVVDGMRLKRDYPRFLKGKSHFQVVKQGVFRVDYPEECFSSAWLGSSVPVIFDFQVNDAVDNNKDRNSQLYCLFPIQIGRYNFLAEISRKTFINTTINGEWLLRASHFMKSLNQVKQEWQNQMEKRQRIQDNINFERFSRAMRNQQRRRRF